MCDNINELATDFNHFIKLHAAGKDGVSMGRPFRYAINTYCMKHTGTIEFRCFRSTINLDEYYGWQQTKYPKERGEKKREFHEVA
jgi:hypothetical protein